MRKPSSLLLALVFLAGCATTHVVSTVPKARAANMQQWEYHCEDWLLDPVDDWNKLGRQGWELVFKFDNFSRFCFKRSR